MNKLHFSLKIALTFFSIGTILFLIQLIINKITLVTFIGLYYVLFAAILNCLIVITLLITLIFDKNRKSILKSLVIIASNIPIALIYFIIVINYAI